MSARKNLTVELGTTFKQPVQYVANGIPVDLAGQEVVFTVKRPGDSKEVYFTKTFEGTVDGSIIIYLADEETATFDWAKGAYTLDVHYANGDIEGLLWGELKNNRRVDV